MQRFCRFLAPLLARADGPTTFAPPYQAAECRASVRRPCHATTFCQLAPGRPDHLCWPAQVTDLSLDGVGLVLACAFKPGTVLEFDLHNGRQGRWAQALVRVVRCAARANGTWLAGCIFAKKLTPEELDALLELAGAL